MPAAFPLLVEHDECAHDTGADRYVQRWFIPYPFCGLKWFRKKPGDLNLPPTETLPNHDDEGWIYGGDMFVVDCKALPNEEDFDEDTDDEEMATFLYPFLLRLQTKDMPVIEIKFAATSHQSRQFWIQEMTLANMIQNYVSACIEVGAVPSTIVLNCTMDIANEIYLENFPVSLPTLGSIAVYNRLRYPTHCPVIAIHFDNCRLGDNHMALIANILQHTPLLQTLSLVENFITDDGLMDLANYIRQCPNLTNLNLTSNFIGNDGAGALAEALSVMKLKVLNMSRNRLTGEVTKDFTHFLGGHDSTLTRLNFSYNPIGDGLGAFAALLMTIHKPIITHVDVSYCALTEQGIKLISDAVRKCPPIEEIIVKGNCLEGKILGELVDSIGFHWTNFSSMKGSNRAALDIVMGGVNIGTDGELEGSTSEAIRSIFTAVERHHKVIEVSMRRRGPTPHIHVDKYP